MKSLTRRNFIKTGAAATLGVGILSKSAFSSESDAKPVRVGVVGTGNRGTSHVSCLLTIEGVEVVALCDLSENKVMNAAEICRKAGRKQPAVYSGDMNSYKQMLDKGGEHGNAQGLCLYDFDKAPGTFAIVTP